MKKRISKEQSQNKKAIQEILEKNGASLQPLLQVLEMGQIVNGG